LLPLRKIAIIMAASFLVVDAGVLTKTLTKTLLTYQPTTLTVKEFTHDVCASFVNATTACRRRRQAVVEFDSVDAIDDLQRSPETINPTTVIPLESTRRPLMLQRVHQHVLQSSRGGGGPYDNQRVRAPFQFGRLFNYFSSLWAVRTFTSVTVTQLINYVRTVTETNTTKTFFVKNCIPPNFTFSTCLATTGS